MGKVWEKCLKIFASAVRKQVLGGSDFGIAPPPHFEKPICAFDYQYHFISPIKVNNIYLRRLYETARQFGNMKRANKLRTQV